MQKKLLKISREIVEQILNIIVSDSEEARKKIVDIARRAEKRYQSPVKSLMTGWFYQYTRTRCEKVEQSINVMKNFPDAYTRLQEFKLMISEGEWNVGSYNYYLFLELIDAISDYQPLEETITRSFVLDLKEQVIKHVNTFMIKYKDLLERKEVESERLATQLRRFNTYTAQNSSNTLAPTFWQQQQIAEIQSLELLHDLCDQKALVMG